MTFRLVVLVPVLIAVAACGGSDDAAPSTEGDGESWCDVVAASNALDDEFNAVDVQDVAAFRVVVDKIGGLGERFRAAAPDDIESQVDAYADTNDRLVEIFAEADYDADAVDNDALSETIGNVDGIATEIDVYTVAECGDSLGPDAT